MKRTIIQTKIFSDYLDELIKKRKFTKFDYDEFERDLLEDPKKGDAIPGLGGLKKIRVGATQTGKRGGLRAIYLDVPLAHKMYLVLLYDKRTQEDLSSEEKKVLKVIVDKLKKEAIKNER